MPEPKKPTAPRKKRLDQLLVEQGYFASRNRAQAAILEGLVFIGDVKLEKAVEQISPEAEITVKGGLSPYVSRGGMKLEHALLEFNVDVRGKIAIDVGASTGGFTDCLLQKGAEKVYAVDVGYGQLAWKIRQDPRVKVFERKNIRYVTLKDLGLEESEIDLAVIDVSFISLSKVFLPVYNLLKEKAEVIALIKPQFEARRGQVGKGGIVKDEKVRKEAVSRVKENAEGTGFFVKGVISSPLKGADGNVEYFLYLKKGE
jgi:23S rRNA (cytidine1920-2'-O)/16S rRNA (cytidine1409-2'-O)-methyltransferase